MKMPPPIGAELPLTEVPSTVRLPETLFQSPPPSFAATLFETVPPVIVTTPSPEICNAPPLPGAADPPGPATFWSIVTSVNVVVDAAVTSMAPPARLAVLSEMFVLPLMVSVPPSLRIPPPLPLAPSATLNPMTASITFSVPPSLNRPPPPLLASSPLATFDEIAPPLIVIVPVEEFHNPPPSLAAVLLPKMARFDVTSAAPVECKPPPLIPAKLFETSVPKFNVTVPSMTSMPPPARLAVLPSDGIAPPIWLKLTVTAPSVLKIPPPLPKTPSAALPLIVELLTVSVPPLLKIAPPPSSAASPEAALPVKMVPSTVIVPVLFQRPPPSRAAKLSRTVPPEMSALPSPEICSAPPLPGAADPSGPATLSSIKTSVSVVLLPAVASIPPPARFAVLSLISPPETVNVPRFRMPPPLPDTPFAMLPVIVESVIVTFPPTTAKAPPPMSTSSPVAVFPVNVTSVRERDWPDPT
ncbi:hypothetical protein RE6C_05404 [Rhodopirellula europaea 6C]|uniref:Uncharacterized protein n=1 Tax=Rhodopirellula europaea 6C TaxID=1263867 RepID=M2A3M3_9BACT|nr:hypothetical protein RE6C_05404 [Rhodopirellula europaea 6C]